MAPAEDAGQAPFARATTGATPRQKLLFRLMRERTHLIGAYQGLSPAQMAEPLGPGSESVRDRIVARAAWEMAAVDALPAARKGVDPALRAMDAGQERAWRRTQQERSRGLEHDDVMRGLMVTRLELIDLLETMPEEPAEMWQEPHAVWWLLDRLARDDAQEADVIKAWQAEREH